MELQGDVFYYITKGRESPSILSRGAELHAWLEARYQASVDPYSKYTTGPTGPVATAFDRKGKALSQGPGHGVNFASQDYLTLSSHPEVLAAAKEAIDEYGVHSAGSPALMGDSQATVDLSSALASFLGYDLVSLFSTGWAAGYGIVTALVGPTDHVVVDKRAHACLLEGCKAATPNVHPIDHLDDGRMIEAIEALRAQHPGAGILVITESLFSMDADTPDLRRLQEACTRSGAALLVDCAHDLGSMGADGLGQLGAQGLRGGVDIVMGSFSKTFASNGGFVAYNAPGLRPLLTYACNPRTFSNALSPVQATIVSAALRLVRSEEGAARRASLLRNAERLREGLQRLGLVVLGQPSPIVPFVAGDLAEGRLLTKHLLQRGALVNLVEHPAVSRSRSLIRLQVMSSHTDEHVDTFLAVLRESLRIARQERAGAGGAAP